MKAPAITLCLGLAMPAYATVILTEDYEVADMAALQAKGWELTCASNPCTMDIVASPVRGSKALRMTYEGVHDLPNGTSDDAHNSKITRQFPGTDEVYERYYVRYEAINPAQPSGFSSLSSKQHYFNPASPAPTAIIGYAWNNPRLLTAANQTTATLCPNGTTDITCVFPPNVANVYITYDTWWCVETHHKMNTPSLSDGIAEIWVNGTLTTRYTNVKFRDPSTAGGNFFSIQIYRQAADNQYRYEDDYVLATTRIGCSGTPSAGDIQTPSVPSGVSAQAVSSSQINLTWQASTDDVGVTGYKIFRAGAQIATTAGTSYSDTGLSASTAYGYTVAAYDAAGHTSAQSPAASAATSAAPAPGPSGLIVDFGSSAGANVFGLAGWNTMIKDVYTTYSNAGPGGTMSGFNGAYDYQGVTGTARSFAAGDELVVTWYNSGASAATFTPQLSMTDQDRVDAGAVWHPMSSATIPAAGTATTRFAFSAATAGSYSLVNVNVNMDYSALICDKIALASAAAPADGLPPAKPRNMRVQ